MKLSIIIPTYNSDKVIHQCLDGVISQTFEDWEVLVMDGASKDRTCEIVRSYKDKRIHLYSESDKGVYDAMNKGIDLAQGEWLYFLGSDDYLYESTSLANVTPYLNPQYDVVYGEVDSDLPEWHRGEWTITNIGANRCHQGIFYNRTFFGDVIRYDLKYKILADFALNLRWFLGRKYRSLHMPVIVAHYSLGGLSTNNKDKAFYDDLGELMLRYGWRTMRPRYKKSAVRQYLQSHPQRTLKYYCLKLYIAYLYGLQKTEEAVGISQEELVK